MANRLGLNLFLWTAELTKGYYPLLGKLKKLGYDTVEIPLLNPNQIDVPRVKRLLEQSTLDCSICSVLPPEAHLGSESAAARKAGVQFIRQVVAKAAELGSDMVAGPLYSPVGFTTGKPRKAAEWKRAVRSYKEIAKVAEDQGVTVAVEPLNRFETYFLNTASDAKRFVQEIGSPRIGILFDTFHANIEEKSVTEAILACDPHLAHFHVSENDRGIPGTGQVDWKGVRSSLRKISYAGRLVVETFGYALPQLSRAASIWRPLYTDSDSFAVGALDHLQQRFGRRKKGSRVR